MFLSSVDDLKLGKLDDRIGIQKHRWGPEAVQKYGTYI